MEELQKKKITVLSDDRKKAIVEHLDKMTGYDSVLRSLQESTMSFINRQVEKIKVEPVPVDRAKHSLKVLSDIFEEKKHPLNAAIERINKEISTMVAMISELDEDKFRHRIENMQVIIDKFKAHAEKMNELLETIDEERKKKLEEAKDIIVKGHRKNYLEKY